jgi:hypothetical protein
MQFKTVLLIAISMYIDTLIHGQVFFYVDLFDTLNKLSFRVGEDQ